jgi:uncharacterized protein YecT (DUF1311 family)
MRILTGLFATVVLTLLALAAPAAADDAGTIKACLKTEHDANRGGRDCIGRVSDPCLQQPDKGSTSSMAECVDTETKIWDDLLNADYQRLLGSLEGTAAASVREAQRAWIALRDADCKVPYDIFDGGSMSRLDGASCVLDHTATRDLRLRAWYDMAHPEEVLSR